MRRVIGFRLGSSLSFAGLVAIAAIACAAPASGSTGAVVSWGQGSDGGLGNGGEADSPLFTPVSGLEDVVGLTGLKAPSGASAGGAALLGDGGVLSWGSNYDGILGDGVVGGPETCTDPCSRVPRSVTGLSEVLAISGPTALRADGTVWTWGSNWRGQLGIGTKTGPESCEGVEGDGPCSRVPVEVPGLHGVRAIAAANLHRVALQEDGTVVAWGLNDDGELGDGTSIDRSSPVAVKGLSDVTAVSAEGGESMALLAGGTVMAWGGIGSTLVPEEVTGIGPVTAISGNLMLLADGHVASLTGVEGKGGSTVLTGVEVAGVSGASAISDGFQVGMALVAEGRVLTWGEGAHGQLGDGLLIHRTTPTGVCGLSGVSLIAGSGTPDLAYLPGGEPLTPAVNGLSTHSGPPGGGEAVTIHGERLQAVETVRFGSTPVAFTALSETAIEATSPAGEVPVDVTVSAPSGTSVTCAGDEFNFPPPPTVTKVTPKTGSAAGGFAVVIRGTNFLEATAVRFGGVAASAFTVKGPGEIEATVPPDTAGRQGVTVTSAGSTSAVSTKSRIKLTGQITGITPSHGPRAGGTLITVNGHGFAPGAGATTFKFGNKLRASEVVCATTSECTMRTPPAPTAGAYAVTASMNKAKAVGSYTYE